MVVLQPSRISSINMSFRYPFPSFPLIQILCLFGLFHVDFMLISLCSPCSPCSVFQGPQAWLEHLEHLAGPRSLEAQAPQTSFVRTQLQLHFFGQQKMSTFDKMYQRVSSKCIFYDLLNMLINLTREGDL